MKVVVSAGGTGGHIYPALAIINKLKEKYSDTEFLYIGTTDRMEASLVPSMGILYKGIEIKGLDRKNLLNNREVYRVYKKAIEECTSTIKEFNPDIVLGIGGYITLPVVLAAHKLGIKTLIHEQNSIPGLSNRILKRYADAVCISMEASRKLFFGSKPIFTGNPRSEEAYNAVPVDKSKYGLSDSKKLVLFVMGSLGSLTITKTMKSIIPSFKGKDYEVLFVTGKRYFDSYKDVKVPSNVKLVPLLDDMLSVLKKTDLIITRAGASTIAEITAIGVPSVMVPSPYVTHNHQEKNARVLEKNGSSVVIKEKKLNKKILLNTIDEILGDEDRLKSMSENAKKLGVTDSSSKIVEVIEELVGVQNV